jgi:glucan biosynthesis protein C
MNHQTDSRRYDIDWLRVLAFILLIFYHIGQFYVADWGWHVKSAYQSEFLKNIMMLVNQWRMPLIFVISGVALSLVEPKISNWSLLKTRFVRIWIPLVIGMYLIVPPQLYYQLIQNDGFTGSYLSFFSIYTDASSKLFPQYHYSDFGLLTWNHLWYLAYLWHYTLVYLLLKPLLTRINWQSLVGKAPAVLLFLVPVGLFMLYGFFLKPYFPKTMRWLATGITTHSILPPFYQGMFWRNQPMPGKKLSATERYGSPWQSSFTRC